MINLKQIDDVIDKIGSISKEKGEPFDRIGATKALLSTVENPNVYSSVIYEANTLVGFLFASATVNPFTGELVAQEIISYIPDEFQNKELEFFHEWAKEKKAKKAIFLNEIDVKRPEGYKAVETVYVKEL